MNDVSAQLGIPILDLTPGSPAVLGGAKVGDLIISMAGQPIKTVEDYVRAVKNRGRTFQMDVLRGNQLLTLTVNLDTQ